MEENKKAEVIEQQQEEEGLSPEELREALVFGALELDEPITVNETGETVTEIKYNFGRIKSNMLMAALRADKTARESMNTITDTQALELFYRAVDPDENKGLTMMDMRSGLGVSDAIFAMQLAASFFTQKWASGFKRIKKR